MDAGKTGALIARLRREKGMNQKELAEKLGVTNKAVSRWETGRGYPDVEILPALSRELGVSVQELLDGELTPEPDQSVEKVCAYAAQEKRRQRRIIMVLAAVLALMVLVRVSVEIYFRLPDFVQSVIGSRHCVIADDYESLTYYGQTYIPLPMNGAECALGEVLVEECQVEGYGFWAKLLFGEKLYEVRGVPDQEIVYLQTETDSNSSDYYVLEAEYEKYAQILTGGIYDCRYASDWSIREIPLETETWQTVAEAQESCECDPYDTDGSFFVFAYEENHIFYRTEGEIRRNPGGFCWMPYVYQEEFDSYMMSGTCYTVAEAAWEDLDTILSDLAEY